MVRTLDISSTIALERERVGVPSYANAVQYSVMFQHFIPRCCTEAIYKTFFISLASRAQAERTFMYMILVMLHSFAASDRTTRAREEVSSHEICLFNFSKSRTARLRGTVRNIHYYGGGGVH